MPPPSGAEREPAAAPVACARVDARSRTSFTGGPARDATGSLPCRCAAVDWNDGPGDAAGRPAWPGPRPMRCCPRAGCRAYNSTVATAVDDRSAEPIPSGVRHDFVMTCPPGLPKVPSSELAHPCQCTPNRYLPYIVREVDELISSDMALNHRVPAILRPHPVAAPSLLHRRSRPQGLRPDDDANAGGRNVHGATRCRQARPGVYGN